MSSSTLRIIAICLAVAALLMGYLGYKASHVANSDVTSQSTSIPEVVSHQVPIASSDIPQDHVITEKEITTKEVTEMPAGVITDPRNVLGKQSRVKIGAGGYFFSEQFHNHSALVSAIPEGKRAIAIRVDEVTGAGGFIEPGNKVDVLLFLPASVEVGKVSSAQRILKGVTVLAFGDDVDDIDHEVITQRSASDSSVVNYLSKEMSSSKSTDKKKSGKKSKTAVLAVNESDASDLMLAESTGRLRLALLGKESELAKNSNGEAEKLELRQLVTLDEYKPVNQNQLLTQPISKKEPLAIRPQQSTKSEITVFTGANASSISVERGD